MNAITKVVFVALEYFEDTMRNAIGWCCRTRNFFRGCSPVSEGCKFCYAMAEGGHQILLSATSAYRALVEQRSGRWTWTGVVEKTGLGVWMAPFQTRKRWLAFINSMSDVFHEKLSEEVVLFSCGSCGGRAGISGSCSPSGPRGWPTSSSGSTWPTAISTWPAGAPLPPEKRYVIPNVWVGVSVENQARADERLPFLATTLAVVRFISVEPLLGPVDLSRYVGALEWVIVGGESGKQFRPMSDDWVRPLRDFTVKHGLAFFKQRAGVSPRHRPELDGRVRAELPKVELLPVPSDDERRAMRGWVEREYKRVFTNQKVSVASDGSAAGELKPEVRP